MTTSTDNQADLNLVHVVRMPRAASPQGERRPCLLLLHGRGADEHDLLGLESGFDPRLLIVSARAPYVLGGGFMWYDTYRLGAPDARTVQSSLEELRGFIDGMVDAYGVNPDRVYLMGFSQGAIMSAALALTNPGQAAGVIMHSGYVPTGVQGADPSGLRDKPFFVAHGQYDDIIPVSYGREAAEYMARHNASLTYQEYPIGHTISEESFYDLSEWLTNELDNNQP